MLKPTGWGLKENHPHSLSYVKENLIELGITSLCVSKKKSRKISVNRSAPGWQLKAWQIITAIVMIIFIQ